MFHKGLNQQIVVEEAGKMIEEMGNEKFSMRLLADRLGVKTASLYTHVGSMEELYTQVGLEALKKQQEYQMEAISGKDRDEAVESLALAYRRFGKEHRELYRFIMSMPEGFAKTLQTAASVIVEPSMKVLSAYNIDEMQRMHWQRVLRGMMHGFISHEENGYFSHYPVDIEESYHLAIECILDGLHKAEKKNEESENNEKE